MLTERLLRRAECAVQVAGRWLDERAAAGGGCQRPGPVVDRPGRLELVDQGQGSFHLPQGDRGLNLVGMKGAPDKSRVAFRHQLFAIFYQFFYRT